MGRTIKKTDNKKQTKENKNNNKETKKEQRQNKKEHKKQIAREKDYNTNEEKKFLELLYNNNLKIIYMIGDGNCMYRSIADQLNYCGKLALTSTISKTSKMAGKLAGKLVENFTYHDVKDVIIDYIIENKSHFSMFIEDDESFEDYVERMR